jgi:hypothetical protein
MVTKRAGPGLRIECGTPEGAHAASPAERISALPYVNNTCSVQEEVQLALSLMYVWSVLLTWLEGI